MELNGKKNNFHLDTFYHQLRTNCIEFGIQMEVINSYIGQVEDIIRKNKWKLQEEKNKDA